MSAVPAPPWLLCLTCATGMQRTGSCFTCPTCGNSTTGPPTTASFEAFPWWRLLRRRCQRRAVRRMRAEGVHVTVHR